MKQRWFCILLALIMFSGCQDRSAPTIETTAETQSQVNIGDYPILFLDTSDNNTKAHVLCAYKNGELISTDAYAYDGISLSEYIRQQETPVSSEILDVTLPISLYPANGKVYDSTVTQVSCNGRIIDETVEVLAELEHVAGEDGERFIGTYTGVDVSPRVLNYGNYSIVVDLDSDDDFDEITWSFSAADPDIYGENYYCNICVTKDGHTYQIENSGTLPCKEEDFEVFVVDVDLNGDYEIVVYTKQMSRFGVVKIYRLEKDTAVELLCYVVNPEP